MFEAEQGSARVSKGLCHSNHNDRRHFIRGQEFDWIGCSTSSIRCLLTSPRSSTSMQAQQFPACKTSCWVNYYKPVSMTRFAAVRGLHAQQSLATRCQTMVHPPPGQPGWGSALKASRTQRNNTNQAEYFLLRKREGIFSGPSLAAQGASESSRRRPRMPSAIST